MTQHRYHVHGCWHGWMCPKRQRDDSWPTRAELDLTSLHQEIVLCQNHWMQLPKGDNRWSSTNVAATHTFPVSSRPDGSHTFLRELTRSDVAERRTGLLAPLELVFMSILRWSLCKLLPERVC